MTSSQHVYQVRQRKDRRGVDLISDALPFGRLWYGEPNAVRQDVRRLSPFTDLCYTNPNDAMVDSSIAAVM